MANKEKFRCGQMGNTDFLWLSPLGYISVCLSAEAVCRISFQEGNFGNVWPPDHALAREVIRQLNAYFEGKLRAFSLPLSPGGSVFQNQVWDAVCRIPYGSTVSYSALSREIGLPDAIRAVAGAIASNPLLLVIPCHRVTGSTGKLTGYSGGLDRKRKLLELERRFVVYGKSTLF
jgi:methylated-DNA-[protein]-cysteine S-methyltransferase